MGSECMELLNTNQLGWQLAKLAHSLIKTHGQVEKVDALKGCVMLYELHSVFVSSLIIMGKQAIFDIYWGFFLKKMRTFMIHKKMAI